MQGDWDVIVVGAGPAGSSAAAILGEHKKRVLLVDREVFPRDKTCGDGMTFKCLEPLARIGARDAFLAKAQFAARGYSLWFSDHTELTVRRSMDGVHSFVYVLPRYSAAALAPYDRAWKAKFNKQFGRAPILTHVVPKQVFAASLARSFDESPGVRDAVGDLHRQYELMFKLKALMKAL